MKNKILIGALCASTLTVSLFSFDVEKAKKFDQFYSNFTPKALAFSKSDISSSEVMTMIRENKKFTFLDIRTRAEMDIIGITAPNTLEIEMQDLFKEKNLNLLPTKELIVMVCHSDARAMVAATSLNMLGFTNIRVLKDGMKGFAKEVGRTTVPLR
ncbi:MAG: rhodanese-like domain-containing protein [Sulfurimonadaceae bacterium]